MVFRVIRQSGERGRCLVRSLLFFLRQEKLLPPNVVSMCEYDSIDWLLAEFVQLMRSCEQPEGSKDKVVGQVYSFLSEFCGGNSKESPSKFAESVQVGAWPDDRFIVFVVNCYLRRPVHVLRRSHSGSAYVSFPHLHIFYHALT